MLRRLGSAAALFGVDVRKTARAVRGIGPFVRNRRAYRALAARSGDGKDFPFGKLYPCLGDRYEESGVATGHYFHQDLLVAQRVFELSPRRHVDVGSRVDGFVAHVASFRQIEVFDIRALRTSSRNITFHQRDIMEERPDLDGCTDSLSCLHTLEHFGLGRYGDPVRPEGYRVGWRNLWRMLEPGGVLHFSVPIGPQRVEYDAHRVFGVPFVVGMAEGMYEIKRMSYVDDAGELHVGVDWRGAEAARSFGCVYGCGVWEMRKR